MHRTRIARTLCLCLLTLVSIASASPQHGRYAGRPDLRRYTRDLPEIDKVELLKLKVNGDLWDGAIESLKTLTGKEAQDVASLWRRQVYRQYQVACHLPAYGVKFYSGDKLLVQASVCWQCNNIGFQTPDMNGTQYFEGDGRLGQQLLSVFRKAFFEPTNYRNRH